MFVYLNVAVLSLFFFPRRRRVQHLCKLEGVLDYRQSSGTNKKDTYRHATGDEQHDTVGPANTQMHTHKQAAAGGKQWDPALTFTCGGLREDAHSNTAHLL